MVGLVSVVDGHGEVVVVGVDCLCGGGRGLGVLGC